MRETESIHAGWYWHPQSSRPAYVAYGPQGWQVQFVGHVPEDQAALGTGGAVTTVTLELGPALVPQLVPLATHPPLVEERRRTPIYPLTLPCQICGTITAASFMPEGNGTWVARPRCDAHARTVG